MRTYEGSLIRSKGGGMVAPPTRQLPTKFMIRLPSSFFITSKWSEVPQNTMKQCL